PPAVYEHDFVLKNRTDKTLHIRSVKTKCGCTAANAGSDSVEPGQSVDIHVRVSFTRPGKKWEPIFVELGDGRIIRLAVEIIARQEQRLTSVIDTVTLPAEKSTDLVIFLLEF